MRRNVHFMLACTLVLLLCGVGSSMADPPAGRNWVPIPELTDEFDGNALDAIRWFDRDPQWPGRAPALFLPGNVAVKDGMLQLAVRAEEPQAAQNPNPKLYHTFTTGFVKSKTLALYGYYEVLAKVPSTNVDAAFWFYRVEPEWHTEIDVFEIFGGNPKQETADRMTVHIFKTPAFQVKGKEFFKSGEIYHAPARFADDFHLFGLEWDADELRWYVDGQVRRTLKNEHNHRR